MEEPTNLEKIKMLLTEHTPARDRFILFGLGAILLLHLGVLATAHAATESPRASVILQAISMFLAALFAALAGARSRDFARKFWILISAGFLTMLAGLLRWQFGAVEEFELFNLLFLFHMVPFGLALLLNDRPRMDKTLNWPMLLDYLQILLMVVILYVGFIYVPSRGATQDQLDALNRYFGFLLVSRNVVVTGGYWARALLPGSRRELLAFRTMAIYLSFYTAVSAAGQYVFLSVHPWLVWLDLNGSVPALLAAWLFWGWRDLPSETAPRRSAMGSVLAVHLIPSILPVLVAVLASSLAKTEPRLAWLTVDFSLVIFAARLLVTIHAEYHASRARLEAELRYQSLDELQQQTATSNLLLRELALTDWLTGLPNRRSVDDWAVRQLSGAARYHFSFWVVLADLDDFKRINDRYGHQAGDAVLKKFAEILKANSRQSDICGRIGGEEFLFVITHATQENAKLVAERIREQLQATEFSFKGTRQLVTASFGMACAEDHPDADFVRLVAHADNALYSAKRLGKNRIEIASKLDSESPA